MAVNKLTVTGFVNKIDFVPGVGEAEGKLFAKIAYSKGEGVKRQTQYLSCYVSKSLHRVAKSAFDSQVKEGDIYINVLGSQLAELTIIDPFFSKNEAGYLEGTGILSSINFLTPQIKQKVPKETANS